MTPNGRRNLYEHECKRKWRHEHSGTALVHAAHLRRIEPESHLAIYVCDWCNGLHVGHTRKNKPHELDEGMEFYVDEHVDNQTNV